MNADAPAAPPVIEARGLTKSYRVGDIITPVLHGITLTAVSYTHLDVYKRQA